MKDCLTRQERQMLSKALFCSEECDVADFIRIIDHRLKDRKEQYDAFMKQFKDGSQLQRTSKGSGQDS